MLGGGENEDGEMNAEANATASALITSVFAATVKLPSFYQANAQFWFDSAESQFRLKNIKDDTMMFDYVMSSLPEEVAMQVIPATRNKSYEELKKALLGVFWF